MDGAQNGRSREMASNLAAAAGEEDRIKTCCAHVCGEVL